MAEIVLSQAGSVIGQNLLPQGVSVLGQTIAGAAIGRTAGSLLGRAIDASLASPIEGTRIEALRITESQEGAGLGLVCCKATRVGSVFPTPAPSCQLTTGGD